MAADFIILGSHPLKLILHFEALLPFLFKGDLHALEFGVLLQTGGCQG